MADSQVRSKIYATYSLYPGPYANAFEVTPNDTTPLPVDAQALYIGDTGDVEVTTKDGDDLTFTAVPAGTTLPVAVSHVKTGTSSTIVIALY